MSTNASAASSQSYRASPKKRRAQLTGQLLRVHKELCAVLERVPVDLIYIITSYLGEPLLVVSDKNHDHLVVYSASTLEPIRRITTKSTLLHELKSPYDVCVDEKRQVFLVACRQPGRIVVTDFDGTVIDVLGTDRVSSPCAIALSPDHERIYVAEENSCRITVLSYADDLVTSIKHTGSGFTGLCISPDNILYAVECSKHCVDAFDCNKDHRFIRKISSMTRQHEKAIISKIENGLYYPWSIAWLAPNKLVLSDGANHSVVVLSASLRDLPPDERFIHRWGDTGHSSEDKELGFHFPRGVACDPDGNIYVSDRDNLRLKKYSPDYQLLAIHSNADNTNKKIPGLSKAYGIRFFIGR